MSKTLPPLLCPLTDALSQDFALDIDGKRVTFTITVCYAPRACYVPRACAEDDPGSHYLHLSDLAASKTVKVPVKEVTP